jgi:hypothetical protein
LICLISETHNANKIAKNSVIMRLKSSKGHNMSNTSTQPETRKSEQICNRSVKSCCQQADIWMRSLALYLSVLTGPQRPVNRSVRSCCDRVAAMLFSTGLLEAVVTELQQCCFQQACRKLLTQSCSNAVFNNLRQTCCKPRKAPYEACVSIILNKKRPNRLPYFGCSVS